MHDFFPFFRHVYKEISLRGFAYSANLFFFLWSFMAVGKKHSGALPPFTGKECELGALAKVHSWKAASCPINYYSIVIIIIIIFFQYLLTHIFMLHCINAECEDFYHLCSWSMTKRQTNEASSPTTSNMAVGATSFRP